MHFVSYVLCVHWPYIILYVPTSKVIIHIVWKIKRNKKYKMQAVRQ